VPGHHTRSARWKLLSPLGLAGPRQECLGTTRAARDGNDECGNHPRENHFRAWAPHAQRAMETTAGGGFL